MTDHKTMYECAVEFVRSLIHEANEQGEKIRRLEAEIRELRAQVEELRFNPNHDPENGRFTSNESSGKGVDIKQKYENEATPGKGSIVFDERYNSEAHKEEIEFAEWLYNNYGGNIELLTEINQDHVRTADYLWNGKLWDLKTTTTEKAANSAIRKGLKQIRENPGGIILDYKYCDVSVDSLRKTIDMRMQWYNESTVDIMIVSKGRRLKHCNLSTIPKKGAQKQAP